MHPIWRPGISHPTKSAPPPTAISWGPRVCGPRSRIDECARSGPRRRTTIWGTWPPNASPPFGITHLVSEIATGLGHIDRPTIDRARRFERAAIESILDRCLDPLYEMCFALTGTAEQSEALTRQAFLKGLDTLSDFRGDESEFQVWMLRSAARAAAFRQTREPGLRQSLAQLTSAEYEL